MSGRILRFEGSAHDQSLRLLPWYVNGTLEGEELLRVTQHLEGCAECRSEEAGLRRLQEACAAHADAREAADAASAAFQRMRQRLRQERRPSWRSWWSGTRLGWSQAPGWLQAALAVQCGVVLAMGGVLLGLHRGEPVARYRTLGDTAPANATAAGEHRFVVVFDPHLDHARMQAMLRASGARIVDGPNDAGAYVLAVPAGSHADAMDALRGKDGVVLVGDLAPGARR